MDAGNTVAESNETDNRFSFAFVAVPARPPVRFTWPVAGRPFVDHSVTNHVDLDPTAGIRDGRGNQLTNDGHTGWDIGVGMFFASDPGVEILAAADGVVSAVRDGEFDRNTQWLNPPPPSNYVVIDHGNGWTTSYGHLRRDSVSVTPGQFVRAGQAIGLMGNSDRSSAPHLHFEVSHFGRSVETLLDPSTYWVQPPRYVLDRPSFMFSGITNHYPVSHWSERPSDVYVFSQAPGQRFRAWVMVSGLRKNSVLQFSAFRPNGSLYSTGSVTAAADYGRSHWSFERTLPTVPDLGAWRIDYRVNGELLGTDSLQVTATGAPEMRSAVGVNHRTGLFT